MTDLQKQKYEAFVQLADLYNSIDLNHLIDMYLADREAFMEGPSLREFTIYSMNREEIGLSFPFFEDISLVIPTSVLFCESEWPAHFQKELLAEEEEAREYSRKMKEMKIQEAKRFLKENGIE